MPSPSMAKGDGGRERGRLCEESEEGNRGGGRRGRGVGKRQRKDGEKAGIMRDFKINRGGNGKRQVGSFHIVKETKLSPGQSEVTVDN